MLKIQQQTCSLVYKKEQKDPLNTQKSYLVLKALIMTMVVLVVYVNVLQEGELTQCMMEYKIAKELPAKFRKLSIFRLDLDETPQNVEPKLYLCSNLYDS